MNRRAIKGFTLVEIMVVTVVFSIVAYGIFSFFNSQSANAGMSNATASVNKNGQVLSNFLRQEFQMVKKWIVADAKVVRFQSVDNVIIEYEFIPGATGESGELWRNTYAAETDTTPVTETELAPNIETGIFHYYVGEDNQGDYTANFVSTTSLELLTPVPACPALTELYDCKGHLNAIRMVEFRFIVRSNSPVYASESLKKSLTTDNPMTDDEEADGRIRRMFTVRAESRNMMEIAASPEQESGTTSVVLTTLDNSISSCDSDGELALIKAVTKVKTESGWVATSENDVNLSADWVPQSTNLNVCEGSDCTSSHPFDEQTDLPVIDPTTLGPSDRPGGEGTATVTSVLDRKGNQFWVQASWTPPVGSGQVSTVSSNSLVFTITGGSADRFLASGPTPDGKDLGLGVESTTELNTCASGGCENTSTNVRLALLDKCGNTTNEMTDGSKYHVKFEIEASTVDGLKYGSLASGSDLDEITVQASDNGVFATSVFSPDNIPPEGKLSILATVVENPSIYQRLDVTLKVCDIPTTLVLVNPASGSLAAPGELKACPGATRNIDLRLTNSCNDVISSISDPAKNPALASNWTFSINSGLADPAEEKQIGKLTWIGATGSDFRIEYATGGTGVSPLDTTYCGNQRSTGITVSYNPLSGQQEDISLNLDKCDVGVSLNVESNLVNGTPIGNCGPVGSEDLCMTVGCPTPTDMNDDWIVNVTAISCPTSGPAVSLDKSVLLVLAENPNDGSSTYPFITEAGSVRNYGTVFGSGSPTTQVLPPVHMNPGSVTATGASTLTQKLDVKAVLCLPGDDGTLNTSAMDTACVGDDVQYPAASDTTTNHLVDFWAGPGKAGFYNNKVVGSYAAPGFVEGLVGIYKDGLYTDSDQLTDPSVWLTYPSLYGPAVETPNVSQTTDVYFEVMDCDQNTTSSMDTIQLSYSAAIGGGVADSGTVTLTETTADSGIFRGSVPMKRYSFFSDPNALDVTMAATVNLTYIDPNDSLDYLSSKFYTDGCKYIALKDASGGGVSFVTPASDGTTVYDTSNYADTARSAFHVEMFMPAAAEYTGSPAGESVIVRASTAVDTYNENQIDYLTLSETDSVGSPTNDGIFRIDSTRYSYDNGWTTLPQDFIFVTNDPLVSDPCTSPDADAVEVCLKLSQTPVTLTVDFDFDNQSSVLAADCSASLSVADVDKPVVTLDKVSLWDQWSSQLPDGYRVQYGETVYMAGSIEDGNGFITDVSLSGDNGLTFPMSVTYTQPSGGNPGSWSFSVDSYSLPDGTYQLVAGATDSNGNMGRSTEDPITDLGMYTMVIDTTWNNIDIYDYFGPICGDYTFTVDTSQYIIANSDKRIDFYVYNDWADGYGVGYQQLGVIPDGSGMAYFTVNVSALSAQMWHSHDVYAIVYDVNNPAEQFSDWTWAYAEDNSPPNLYSEVWDGAHWNTPYSGVIDATLYFWAGCKGPATIAAQLYDPYNPVEVTNWEPATLDTCWYNSTLNPAECISGMYKSTFDTNPASCSPSDGYTGDGETVVIGTATDTGGLTVNSWPNYFKVDNAPIVTGPGGGVTAATVSPGVLDFKVNVKDCDGITGSGNVLASVTNNTPLYSGTTFGVPLTLLGGSLQNGIWGFSASTTNFPACAYNAGYLPDGNYSVKVTADDGVPATACAAPGTPNEYNVCGYLPSVNFTIGNDPAPPNSLTFTPLFSGNLKGIAYITFQVTDCDIMYNVAGSYVRLLVDDEINNSATGSPWIYTKTALGNGNYQFTVDTKQIEGGAGSHKFTIVAYDGTGAPSQISQTLPIDNSSPCQFTANYSKVMSGSWKITITGDLRKTVDLSLVTAQAISVKQNFGMTPTNGATQFATTSATGTWSVSFNYLTKPSSANFTVNISNNLKCNNLTVPLTFTVP